MNYFIIVNGAQQGPYTIEELRQRHIDSSTLVWTEGMAQWTPAWQVEELKTLFNDDLDNGPEGIPTPPPMPGNAYGTNDTQQAQSYTQGTTMNIQEPHTPRKTMKTWTWIGAAAVALMIGMAVTNPSRDEHRQVVKENISNGIEKGLGDSNEDSGSNPFKAFGSAMLKAFATPLVNMALDNMLQYHNYLLWSTTSIELPDSEASAKPKTVRTSLGIFGKVFTSDEDDIAKAITKIMNEDSSSATQPSIVDDNDDTTSDNNGDNNDDINSDDFASQVTDSVLSIGGKVGKSVAKQVGHEVSRELKKEIRQNTDSTTASGLGKIVDAVESFLKGL